MLFPFIAELKHPVSKQGEDELLRNGYVSVNDLQLLDLLPLDDWPAALSHRDKMSIKLSLKSVKGRLLVYPYFWFQLDFKNCHCKIDLMRISSII